MSRRRTHRTSKYYSISNATCQDDSISFEALGLLSYCLSMPEDWEFHPKVIWKQRNCSRDKVYRMFNELISTFHCIRIQLPNPKARHLPGEVEYEFYDDIDVCKARIKELQNSENFITHGDNLKKCLRHPEYQDPKGWDPNSQEETKKTSNTNKTNNTKKTTTTTPTPSKEKVVVVVSSSEEEEAKCNECAEKMNKHLTEFSKSRNTSWRIAIKDLFYLCRVYGCNFVSDQLNYMINIQLDAERDEKITGKQRKTKPVDKPLPYLSKACKENYAKSFNNKDLK